MKLPLLPSFITIFALGGLAAQAAAVWTLGAPGRVWPLDGAGGGPDVDFIQESGVDEGLPGSPTSSLAAQMGDNDYYFAGSYASVGAVATDELGAERAFAVADNSMRVHHNLTGILSTDLLSVSFEAINLDGNGADPRYGIEIYINDNLVRPEQVIRDADLNTIWTSSPISAASVGAVDGFDNIVELRGVNYNGDAVTGGNWMGIDYIQLDADPIPEPAAPVFIAVAAAGIALIRRRRS